MDASLPVGRSIRFADTLARLYGDVMDQMPPRTLLERIVRQSRRTVEESCTEFEKTARDHGEDATLSPRQLCRWMAGEVRAARPVCQRVAESHWGYSFEVLVGPPDDPRAKAEVDQYDHVAAALDDPSAAPALVLCGGRGVTTAISGVAGWPASGASSAVTGQSGSWLAEILMRGPLRRTPDNPAWSPLVASPGATALAHELKLIDVNELAQVIVMWLQQFNPIIGRRDLLAKLGAAVALAGAAPLFDAIDPDEQERVARAFQEPSRLDATTLAHHEAMVTSLR